MPNINSELTPLLSSPIRDTSARNSSSERLELRVLTYDRTSFHIQQLFPELFNRVMDYLDIGSNIRFALTSKVNWNMIDEKHNIFLLGLFTFNLNERLYNYIFEEGLSGFMKPPHNVLKAIRKIVLLPPYFRTRNEISRTIPYLCPEALTLNNLCFYSGNQTAIDYALTHPENDFLITEEQLLLLLLSGKDNCFESIHIDPNSLLEIFKNKEIRCFLIYAILGGSVVNTKILIGLLCQEEFEKSSRIYYRELADKITGIIRSIIFILIITLALYSALSYYTNGPRTTETMLISMLGIFLPIGLVGMVVLLGFLCFPLDHTSYQATRKVCELFDRKFSNQESRMMKILFLDDRKMILAAAASGNPELVNLFLRHNRSLYFPSQAMLRHQFLGCASLGGNAEIMKHAFEIRSPKRYGFFCRRRPDLELSSEVSFGHDYNEVFCKSTIAILAKKSGNSKAVALTRSWGLSSDYPGETWFSLFPSYNLMREHPKGIQRTAINIVYQEPLMRP